MRAAWLELDLEAYRGNLRALAEYTGRPVLAVVKANAYGHGMVRMAQSALEVGEAGCCGVAVALPEEGAELRETGQTGRIVVLGLALEEQAGLLVEHNLEAVVTRPEVLEAFAEAAARTGRRARVHVKVDTGMSRVGVDPEEALAFCRRVRDTPSLDLAGVLTHFACAEEEDQASMREQWDRFEPLLRELQSWPARPLLHAANSAAALWFPPARLDWVRCGLVTYGVSPAPRPLPVPVRPVAALRGRVVQVREIPAGRSVSYGATWTAERRTRLALVPLGYGDGYPWALGNLGEAILRGQRVPIRGRVCMDQLLLDVTDLPPVEPGEVATFIGCQGDECISVENIADLAGTIPYEVLTRFAARLPRVPVNGACYNGG